MTAGWDWLPAIDPADPTPLHAQLERSIRVAIGARRLRPGDQLPTVRQLAVALRINANTVARVYTHLERLGTLETRRGVGTFVAETVNAVQHQSAREAELRALAIRAAAEASARGFTVTDLRRELLAIEKGASSS